MTTPADETTQLDNTSDGLLTSMTTPRGHTYSYAYDTWVSSRRTTTRPAASRRLTETGTPTGYTVDVATALGRTTRYAVERLPTGSTRRTTTDPAGLQEQQVRGTDDTWVTTYPTARRVDHPRSGPALPHAGAHHEGLDVHHAGRLDLPPRRGAHGDPDEPAGPAGRDLADRTDTINGRVYASTFDAATRRITQTSPDGRQVVTTVDARVVHSRSRSAGSCRSLHLRHPRPTRARSPRAPAAPAHLRQRGLPDSVTDPLDRTTTFAYDAAGRG